MDNCNTTEILELSKNNEGTSKITGTIEHTKSDINQYTLDEVKVHNNCCSTWVVFKGVVFDVTKYLDLHPGGAEAILQSCGGDITRVFEDVGHSENAREVMRTFKIGELKLQDRSIEGTREKCAKSIRSNCVIL